MIEIKKTLNFALCTVVGKFWPWGSEITAEMLKRRIKDAGHKAYIQDYTEPLNEETDIIFLEGWLPDHAKKRIKEAKKSIHFWGSMMNIDLNKLKESPVDGILAYSQKAYDFIKPFKKSRLWMGFAETSAFKPVDPIDRYKCDCIYIGVAKHKSPKQEDMMIGGASKFDLKVYGGKWDETPHKSHHYGILPMYDIASAYASAKIVLGMCEWRQKEMGFINTRVYEALSCESVLLHEWYPALEEEFKDMIVYSKSKEETESKILHILANYDEYKARAKKAREYIIQKHSCKQRALELIEFAKEIL